MPKFGMTQTEATVVRWLKQEGDTVQQGDVLLEVETDKTIMEVEAPCAGTLAGITAQPKQVVPVTTVIAYILEPGESLPASQPQPATPTGTTGTVAGLQKPPSRATPVAVKRAAEAGIDIGRVPPSSPSARVTRQDVEDYLRCSSSPRTRATPAARRIACEQGVDLAALSGSGPRGRVQAADVLRAAQAVPAPTDPVAQVVPLEGMRRTIATRMQMSYQTVPHIMLTVEVDMSAAQALRSELNARAKKADAPNISVTAILVKVCAWALRRHPWVNASLRDDSIYLHDTANIGVAVALETGLIVPVIRQAETLGLGEIAARLQSLTGRAREGRLTPDDVSGGTFTISNLGMFGISHFTAIINPPQSAILAVGRIDRRPVVERETDEIVIRPMMSMTLSADHRVLDGAVAARFLQDVVDALEHPNTLFM